MAVTNVGSPEIFNTQLMVPNSNRRGGGVTSGLLDQEFLQHFTKPNVNSLAQPQ